MRYLLLALLVGCASVNPQQFSGPNGREAYVMACSGMGRSLHDCYLEAGRICPKGYDVIDARAATAAVGVGGRMIAAPQHTLAVECR